MTNFNPDTGLIIDRVSHVSPMPPAARRHRRLLGALAGTMLLAGSAVVAGHASASADRTAPCTATTGGSAHSLERQGLACRVDLLTDAVQCLRSTSGTPTAVERWTDYCIAQVTADD